MADTLEITKKLEGAGFERGQAEAVATVVAGGAGARDKQLDEIRADIQRIGFDLAELKTLIAKSRTEQIVWTVSALGVLADRLRLFP
jgi:hypothetical protein